MQSQLISLLLSGEKNNIELATTLAISQGWDIEKIITEAGFNDWNIRKAASFESFFKNNLELNYKAEFNPQIFQYFGRVQRLFLDKLGLKDCSFFHNMPDLYLLSLQKNQLEDISGLAKTPAIQTLYLQGNQLATRAQLAILTQLTCLTWLDLGDNPISELDIWPTPPIIDHLSLNNTQIQQIDFLDGWTQLRTLYISENNFSNGLKLPHLPNLSTLSLGNCKLKQPLDLQQYPNLYNLYLYSNQLSDVGDFSSLSQLSSLMIGGNRITKLSIAHLPANIKNLNLVDSRLLTDISKLAALTNLEFLNIRGCPKITKEQLQIIKKDNKKLYIEGSYENNRYEYK